jgi:predicted ATPase
MESRDLPFSDHPASEAAEQVYDSASRPAEEVLRFTSIHLRHWRNFKDAGVELQSRVFLVGPNASGKSNFLDAFRFLRDVASESVGFKAAVDTLRPGVRRIRCLSATSNTAISIRVTVGTDAEPRRWTYELAFDDEGTDRHPVVRREFVQKRDDVLLERPTEKDQADPKLLRQPFIQLLPFNEKYRELAEFLQGVRYLHLVPQLVRDPERSAGRKDDPFGGDFLEQLAATPSRTRTRRLKRIERALRAVVPQLTGLRFEDSRTARTGRHHLEARYEHWRPQGAWQDEEQLSDGTLRLVGLLWALLEGQGTLLLEEPELSLHPGIIRVLPLLFAAVQAEAGRQIIVSTHSPELVAEEGIGLDEVILLKPALEGTVVRPAARIEEVSRLVSAGISLPEALQANTGPADPLQLLLFTEPAEQDDSQAGEVVEGEA